MGNGSKIIVKGKFGTLETMIPKTIAIQQDEKNILTVSLKENTRNLRPLHGLYRTLINNMIIGVSQQFELTLILKGVGYRAIVEGEQIVLNSCDKELLGLFASNIRAWRRPEPYKGKGIL